MADQGQPVAMPVTRRSEYLPTSIPVQQPQPPAAASESSNEQNGVLQRLLSSAGLGGLGGASRLQLSISTPRAAGESQNSGAAPAGEHGTAAAGGEQPPPDDVAEAPGGLALAVEGGLEAALQPSTAEAAERHRLLTPTIDVRQLAASLERGLPFGLLLALLFVAEHAVGLCSFAVLSYVLYRLNAVIRGQVALKSQLQAAPLRGVAGVVLALVPLALLLTGRQRVYAHVVLLGGPSMPVQFWDVLFTVVVGDAIVRYASVLAKVAVLLVARVDSAQQFRRRGHALTAVEYSSALYRSLLPVPLWYNFFKEAPRGAPLLSTVCSGVYLLLKCSSVYERFHAAGAALRQAASHSPYGCAPSQDDLAECGNSCPICQDNLRDAIKLHCGHVFCDVCIGEWFERERSCPMCRAAVRPASIRSFSDGTTPLLPIVF